MALFIAMVVRRYCALGGVGESPSVPGDSETTMANTRCPRADESAISEFARLARATATLARLALAPALATLTPACGPSEPEQGGHTTVNIYSWWIAEGEEQALQKVIAMHEATHPNVTVENQPLRDAGQARLGLTNKLEQYEPPDAYQANIGQDLFTWVNVNGKDSTQSPLASLDQLVSVDRLDDKIRLQVTFDEKLWAVPVNIHRINSLFYNKRAFAMLKPLGINEPSETMSYDDFVNLCAALKQARPDASVLGLGNSKRWTLEELVFEDVLPSIAGPDFYEQFWSGKGNPNDLVLAQTIEQALRLADYFNSDFDTIDWPESLGRMMATDGTNPPVLMVASGDWAKGYLQRTWEPDVDFGVVQFPSAKSTFIYTADSLALPLKDSATFVESAAFLQTFASPEAQVEFSRIKGSIPVRTDFDLGRLDTMQQQTYAAWASSSVDHRLAMSGLIPNGYLASLADAVDDTFTKRDKTIVLNYLKRNYTALSPYWH